MHNRGPSTEQPFAAPALHLADIDPARLAAVVSAAADIALVIDAQGVIRDVSLGGEPAAELDELRHWVGRRWSDTVTVESRPKVQALLAGPAGEDTGSLVQRRQVNHPLSGGLELPVSYRLVPLGDAGMQLALGRNLRSLASVQQRLVDAQQAMERDYLRLRHAEARYRLLFDTVGEPLLVLDGTTLAVIEHNQAAARLLGEPARRINGRAVHELFAADSHGALQALAAQARSAGTAELSEHPGLHLISGGTALHAQVSLFKQDSLALLLLRLEPAQRASGAKSAAPAPSLLAVVNAMPDAFVLTDLQGRILSANQAFADMLQLPAGDALVGQSLDRWLGRSSVDLNVLIANLRQHGQLRLFPTTLRSGYGEASSIEISAVAVQEGSQPCLGFAIRDVSRRLPAEGRNPRQLPRSAEQLTGLVGRLPLKDIVGETTDLIERLCIEAALELTRDNRASAAEMLGLSRQSLYVKLRRYGMQAETDSAS